MLELVFVLWLLVVAIFIGWLFYLHSRAKYGEILPPANHEVCPDCRGAGGKLLWFGRLITFPTSWTGPQKRVAANTFMCRTCTGRGWVAIKPQVHVDDDTLELF